MNVVITRGCIHRFQNLSTRIAEAIGILRKTDNMLYMKPTITILYCPKCGWMLRSAYIAQELLTTFVDDLYGVTLVPSEINGRFSITIGDTVVFDRKITGRFPETKEIKQLVRDIVNPTKDLGHSDKK